MPRRATLAPDHPSVTVYMVLDDLGQSGRVWREADEDGTDEREVVRLILDGQFYKPIKVVAFNTEEGWSRDVTEDIARAVIETARKNGDALLSVARAFVERATGEDVPA